MLLDLPRAPLPDGATRARAFPADLGRDAPRSLAADADPSERFRPLVFNTKTPHSVNTFLVDGGVAGTWRVERAKENATLLLEPFERLASEGEQELRDEGERLVGFVEPDATSHRVTLS